MPLFSDSVRALSSSLIVAAVVISGLVFGKDILIPMTLAILLAFILSPIVRRLMRMHIPKALAVAAVMLGVVASLAGFTAVVSNQMISLAADMSSYRYNFVEKIRTVTGHTVSAENDKSTLSRAAKAVEEIGTAIRKELSPQDSGKGNGAASGTGNDVDSQKAVVVEKRAENGTPSLGAYLSLAAGPLAQAVLTFFLTAFLLLQYQDLRDRVVRVVGTDHMTDTISAMGEAGERLSQLFLTQAMLNSGFGVFVGTALWFIGVPNAILWGVVTAVLRFVPYVGSILAAIPPLILAAAVDYSWSMFLWTLAVYLIGEPIMGHVIEPLALGKRAGISPFAMVTSASFWTLIWGPIGLILAAPLTMTLIVVGRYIPGLAFFSVLLGDEPALTPPHEFYHRLLSEDSISAAEQVERAVDENGISEVADTLIFPALSLAAQDYHLGRLDREQIEELRTTSLEVWDALQGSRKPDDGERRAPERQIMVLPARGAIDGIAARFVGRMIETEAGFDVAVCGLSGLTALAEAKTAPEAEQPDEIVIVSVSAIDQRQIAYIVRRAVRDFPGHKVTVVDFRTPFDRAAPRTESLGENVTLLRMPSSVGDRYAIAAQSRTARPATEFAA